MLSSIITFVVAVFVIVFFISIIVLLFKKRIPCPECQFKLKVITDSVKCPKCKTKLYKQQDGSYSTQN